MNTQSGCAGVKLIELLVVVAVVAVLQTLASPALQGLTNTMRLTTATNSLFSSLLLARSEAIKRNARAVVCKSVTGDACATAGGWEQGWIVFHDVNNNAVRDAGETLLSREQAVPNHLRLTGNSPLSSYISYTAMGTTSYTSGAFQVGTVTVCSQRRPTAPPVRL